MTTHSDHSQSQRMTYIAYLVRLWQENPNGEWRGSAQSVQSGEIRHFGSQQALFAFLESELHKPTVGTDDEE